MSRTVNIPLGTAEKILAILAINAESRADKRVQNELAAAIRDARRDAVPAQSDLLAGG